MANPTHLQVVGNQIAIIFDDGSRNLAYPTGSDLFIIRGTGGTPPGGDGEFVWPFSLDTVSSEYGVRDVTKFHEGIDLAPGAGTNIPAAGNGTISVKQDHPNFGNMVIIDHGTLSIGPLSGKQVRTLYAHMEAPSPLSVGDATTKGATILGTVGNTGGSFGAHLHWEVHITNPGDPIIWNTNNNGNPRTAINPRDFMAEYGS